MKRTSIVAIFGFLLTGCTLGPDYLRPTMLIPDNYRGVVDAPAAESIADLPWWELFRDPVLQELTREALQNNFDLRIAVARVEQARAQISIGEIRQQLGDFGRVPDAYAQARQILEPLAANPQSSVEFSRSSMPGERSTSPAAPVRRSPSRAAVRAPA
jgi:outer membrane protein TolC